MGEQTTQHTPTPWSCHSGMIWQDGPDVYPTGNKDGTPITHMDREPGNGTLPVERDANADFIVQACNSHDALLEAALKAIKYDEVIKSCANEPDKMASYCTAEGTTLDSLYFDWMTSSRAAIAKAENETEAE